MSLFDDVPDELDPGPLPPVEAVVFPAPVLDYPIAAAFDDAVGDRWGSLTHVRDAMTSASKTLDEFALDLVALAYTATLVVEQFDPNGLQWSLAVFEDPDWKTAYNDAAAALMGDLPDELTEERPADGWRQILTAYLDSGKETFDYWADYYKGLASGP